MSRDSQEIVVYLRQHRGFSRQQVMKALGVSAEKVRLAEKELAADDARRAKRRMAAVLGAVALAGLAYAGHVSYQHWRDAQREALEAEKAKSDAITEREERRIYEALDTRDRERIGEIAEHLGSEQEPLRLAALRYLAAVDPEQHKPELVALLDDSSSRVRRAAIQLVGRLEGEEVEERLVSVVLGSKRDQAERMLGLSSLRGRASSDRVGLARALLPALLDDSGAVRTETESLLTQLLGQGVEAPEGDRTARHALWRETVNGASK